MTYRSIWLEPEEPARTGRPAEWSRAQITEAALAVADADGLAAVTMRRVASRLGTGAASLYRYVATRDDLLDLMADAALAAFTPAPDSGDWRDDLVADHIGVLHLLRARPWLLDIVRSRPAAGPNGTLVVENTLARMAGHPAPGARKMEVVGTLFGMIQTYAASERPGGGILDDDFLAVQVQLMRQAVASGRYPHLAAVLAEPPTHTGESPDDQLARVLRLVLAGMLPEQL
ncbi:TetR family transcriptional regulator [Pseudonocardia sulfidoxydans NBRC 16205]|uniref:TetR family transcriptional regulator n=2 Tax=Pseudonocardia sulfidoxydans TaxID=54011 RepID=A0A511DIT5_9PSEU|nr:TetR/AcrR family transcriptional regulator [Pseudonocardia sulfidoxydans]GEL24710.1 TetR family transcriptional regulator [Pseudonocardia sulfidoxydans NBRC 16205]